MPKYTHGGDEGGGAGEDTPKKRLDLDRYTSRPDANIRDTFWAIMAAYATKKSMRSDIKIFQSSRIALTKIAFSVLGNPESAYYGLSLSFVVIYTLMMLLDGEWEREFIDFLTRCHTENVGRSRIASALRKLLANKEYRDQLIRYFKGMVSAPECAESALSYINEAHDVGLVDSLKREITIIARNDVDLSQRNAMSCLFLLKDQPDVLASLSQLLAHWDDVTREHAATLLKDTHNNDIVRIAKSQFMIEANPKIKKLLGRIIEENENPKKAKIWRNRTV